MKSVKLRVTFFQFTNQNLKILCKQRILTTRTSQNFPKHSPPPSSQIRLIDSISTAAADYRSARCNPSACSVLLPGPGCMSGQSWRFVCSRWPCELWEQWLKSKWLTSSQLSQALQSCYDLILCLSAPSAPLIDLEWGASCWGKLAPSAGDTVEEQLYAGSREVAFKCCMWCSGFACKDRRLQDI